MTDVFCGPSIRSSSTPVTVTVFGALQSELLKTSVVGETVASSVSALAMSKTTGPSGCAVRTTVN